MLFDLKNSFIVEFMGASYLGTKLRKDIGDNIL